MPVIGWIAGFIYGLVKDALVAGSLEGRSVGKYITKLQAVDESTGKPISYGSSIVRNIVWYIPILNLLMLLIEAYLAATDEKGQRVGDRLAKTQVVSTK